MRPAILAAVTLTLSSPAIADPCKAIPDRGPMPTYLRRGMEFSGPVVAVLDGDGLCVDVGSNVHAPGSTWVEVRVADFYAPELHDAGGQQAKRTLSRIAMGRQVTCIAGRRSYDRVVASCRLDGVGLGDLLRGAGITEGGRGHQPNISQRGQ